MKSKKSKFLLLTLFSAFLFSCGNSKKESAAIHDAHSYHKGIEQLSVSPNQQVLSRQGVIKLSSSENIATIKADGYIDFDKTRSESVAARFGGRIEKLYVKYNVQYISQGEKILDIYSPELSTYQEEHLLLMRTNQQGTLVEKSRERLKLLGITENQISELERTGTVRQSITVFSPANGFVFFNVNQSAAKEPLQEQKTEMQDMNMASGSATEKAYSASGSQTREGDYVNAGQTLFAVNDLKTVWAVLSIPYNISNVLQANQTINIRSELVPDKLLQGKIILTEQIFEEPRQRFTRLRVLLDNTSGLLKLNSVVSAEIPPGKNSNLYVPASAVYRTGLNTYVWLKTGTTAAGTGIFELRKVTIGSMTDDLISITGGLAQNDEIGKEAGMMTDSETLLNVK